MEIMQTALLETEYIMTLCGEMDPPQRIDETLSIFNVTGGWAKGPKINATVIQPAADWIQSVPDDSRRTRCAFDPQDGRPSFDLRVLQWGDPQHPSSAR